ARSSSGLGPSPRPACTRPGRSRSSRSPRSSSCDAAFMRRSPREQEGPPFAPAPVSSCGDPRARRAGVRRRARGAGAGRRPRAPSSAWKRPRLLAWGPSEAALVPSPIMQAMRHGKVARVEELTRLPGEVQDTLITVLSEKTLPVPELGIEVQARKGFNVIGTANSRDKGVNELSSALSRRFNTVVLPTPDTLDEEVEIVSRRVADLGRALQLPAEKPALEEIRRVVTVFRELRSGVTADGKTKLK